MLSLQIGLDTYLTRKRKLAARQPLFPATPVAQGSAA